MFDDHRLVVATLVVDVVGVEREAALAQHRTDFATKVRRCSSFFSTETLGALRGLGPLRVPLARPRVTVGSLTVDPALP